MHSAHAKSTLLSTALVGALSIFLSSFSVAQDDPCGSEGTEKGNIESTWQSLYPASNSLNHVIGGTGKGCQLCHRDTSGGDPFNGYGWAIRDQMNGGLSVTDALVAIATSNSDADPSTSSNLDEIGSGTQPGWTDGANNTIFYKSGFQQTGRLAPSAIQAFNDPMSFSTTSHNGTGVNPVILTDSAGDPTASPAIGSTVEPFGVSLDCSAALSPGFYGIVIQNSLKTVPQMTKFGEVLGDNPVWMQFVGPHSRNSVVVGPMTLPYDIGLVGITYCVQGFCGDPTRRAFVSNALGQTVGI